MLVLKLQLLKLNIPKYGLENILVKMVIKMPKFLKLRKGKRIPWNAVWAAGLPVLRRVSQKLSLTML
jgi:hypothetical protein